MTKLNSIQFLRALAATLVVYQHIISQDIGNEFSWQQNFYHLKYFGSIGVDIFFIISGFIIMYVANTYTGLQQGINFLVNRFCRINPVYYISTLFSLLVLIIFQISGINMESLSSLNELANSLIDALLIIPVTANLESFSPLLIVGWTLSFEWLFYVLFFLLILCKVKQKTFYLIGLIGLLFLLGQLLKPSDFRLIFLTNPILLEFLLGVVLYRIYLNINLPVFISVVCIMIGLSTYILLIVYGFGKIWHYHATLNGGLSINRFMIWGLPSSFIVAGCVFLEKKQKLCKIWNKKWIQLAGDASFSIYLIHTAIFPLLRLFFIKAIAFMPTDLIMLLQMLIAGVVSIGFYKIVEKPLIQFIRNNKLWDTLTMTKSKRISYE